MTHRSPERRTRSGCPLAGRLQERPRAAIFSAASQSRCQGRQPVGMVAILVRFELKDEAAARGFDALVEETASAIQASEPDTLIYAVHRVADAPAVACLLRVVREPGRARSAWQANTPSVFSPNWVSTWRASGGVPGSAKTERSPQLSLGKVGSEVHGSRQPSPSNAWCR